MFGRHEIIRRRSGGRWIYSGRFFGGKATYEYVERDGMRVYDGRFRYAKRYVEHPESRGVVRIAGRYAMGKKDGRWRFERNDKGCRRRLEADYAGGVPHGYVRYSRKGNSYGIHSVVSYCSLELRMVNGHPSGEMCATIGGCRFSARCDEDGWPDGLWTLDGTSVGNMEVDHERWSGGELVESYSVDLSTGCRRDKPEHMIAMIRDVVCYECMPLVNAIDKDAAVWHGDISVRKS